MIDNLLPGEYLNVPLRSHPQHQLSFCQDTKTLILNSGEKLMFFDMRLRFDTGSSGLVKVIKRQDIIDDCKFGESPLHPCLLQRVVTDSNKEEPASYIKKALAN